MNFSLQQFLQAQQEAKYLKQQQIVAPHVEFSVTNFLQLINGSEKVFFIFSGKTDKLLFVSPKFEEIWGKDCRYLYKSNNNWIFQIHTEDYSLATNTIITRWRSDYTFVEKFRIVHSNGTFVPIRVICYPLYSPAMVVSHYVAVVEDLRVNNLLEPGFFFENSSQPLAITDHLGKFLRVNRAFCQLIDRSQTHLEQIYWQDLLVGECSRDYLAIAKGLIDREYNYIEVTRNIKTENGIIELLLKVSLGQLYEGNHLFYNQITDIRERRFIEAHLKSSHDLVSNLPNDVSLIATLDAQLSQSISSQFVYLQLSFEDLKRTLNSLDQAEELELINQIVERIENNIYASDFLARMDRVNFGIILFNLGSSADALKISDRLLQRLKEPFSLVKRDIYLHTLVALVPRNCSSKGKSLVRKAGLTLDYLRDEDSSQIKLYDAELEDRIQKRFEIIADLPRAIKESEFCNFYQPIVNLQTGNLFGFEALARWKKGSQYVSPGVFIPLLEKTGLILPLGKSLLNQACIDLRNWQIRYPNFADLRISVNVSALQFYSETFVSDVDQALFSSGLNPAHLKLEITESLFIEDFSLVQRILKILSGMGIRFSIDDFGTGYSSLSYLQMIPAHTLKLDRAFVMEIQQEKNLAIAQSVVTLGHMLSMDIIAEGVETENQLEHLTNLQCEYGQGYYFDRPLSTEQVEEYLKYYIPKRTKIEMFD